MKKIPFVFVMVTLFACGPTVSKEPVPFTELPEIEAPTLTLEQPGFLMEGDSFFTTYNFIYDNFALLAGKKVEYLGFLAGDLAGPEGAVVMGREMTYCCSADTSLIGFYCQLPANSQPRDRGWYKVSGTLDQTTNPQTGKSMPLVLVDNLREEPKPQVEMIYPLPVGLP